MTTSPFSATAREIVRSVFPHTSDNEPVEILSGELVDLIEQGMTQAAGRLDALHTTAGEAFDKIYHAADAALGIVRLLADEKSPLGAPAANLLELVCDRLAGVGSDLEMACRKAEAGNQEGQSHE